MWTDGRQALADLDLAGRRRILDVGCGTGELTRVIDAETPSDTTVIGVDADPKLLRVAREETGPRTSPATRYDFPFRTGPSTSRSVRLSSSTFPIQPPRCASSLGLPRSWSPRSSLTTPT